MQTILENHLMLTETPEMFNLYDRIINLFEQYDVEDYELAYDDILISSDGAVDGVSVSNNEALHDITMKFAKMITKEHQIYLTDDASLLHYILVLEFIKQIERTELVEESYEVLVDENTDNFDKFTKLLLDISGVLEEDSMLFIREIPDCVIRTMTAYFKRRVELETVTETLDENTKEVYREMDKYVRVIKGQAMRSAQYLFEEEGCIGMPFEYHFKENQEYLMKLPLQAMLYECIGYALISEDGLSNPEYAIISVVGKYIGDLDRLTVIQYELSKTLITYRNEVASGVGIVQ